MIRRNTRRAFTLIELLLVMVILAVLAAVVVPKFVNRGDDARRSATITSISNLETAMDAFEVDNGRYPLNDEGLAALVDSPAALTSSWKGPYIKKVPLDGWGADFMYRYPSTLNASGYDLWSKGKDGNDGTEDDITNH